MSRFIFIIFIGCCLFATATFAQNLLVNGNLDQTYAQLVVDNPPAGPGPEDLRAPKPLGWVNEATRAISGPTEEELSSEPWAGPAPTPVTSDSNGLPWPEGPGGPDGAVFFRAFIGSPTNGAVTAHLYQDVPATPGLPYRLAGWAGGEPNVMMAGAEIALEFRDAGSNVIPGALHVINLLPTLTTDNGQPFEYKLYDVDGIAPAGTAFARARVSMIGGMANPAGGGQAFVVDDFSVTVVPEPSSAATAAALMALAAAGYPRRRAQRPAGA